MQHLPKILRFGTERVLGLTDMITVPPLSTSVNAVPPGAYTVNISSTCFNTSYA